MKLLFGMEHSVVVVALFLTCSGRQTSEKIYHEQDCINLEAGQKGFIQLAKREEPGEPLVIHGKVIDRQTNQPIKDASLFLYQTDSSGIYNAAGGPDDQARVRGTVQTNESGCFNIKTILPGDYPGQKNSRHLHYIINANGYKELKSLLFFKGFTTENLTSEGPLAVVDIKKGGNGIWIGSINMSMERSNRSIR